MVIEYSKSGSSLFINMDALKRDCVVFQHWNISTISTELDVKVGYRDMVIVIF